MDRQQILLAKTLEVAGIPRCVETFDDRLILQKATYLLQSAGIRMGFRFRWYLRGPYSPDMTTSVFGILDEEVHAGELLQRWTLDEHSTQRAEQLRPLLHRVGESKVEQAKRLELLASALFLFNTKQANSNDPDATSAILKKNGKDFSPRDVLDAVTVLRAHSLVV